MEEEINLIVFFLLHSTCSCERAADKNEVHELNKKTILMMSLLLSLLWVDGREIFKFISLKKV